MGKSLRQQKRGKGSIRFRAPSFRYRGVAKHPSLNSGNEIRTGVITDFIHCPGHSAPLAQVSYAGGEKCLTIAPAGMKVGDIVYAGGAAEPNTGNTLALENIPEGTLIFNIESKPGDGGKFARTSGAAAKILTKSPEKVVVLLPSKKQREFNLQCRASIGIVAGQGRTEKPFLKAGNHHYHMKQRNHYYPHVNGLSMNAVDHPYGGSRSSKKGKVTIAPRNAPPGRKVGLIRPRRSGRRR